MSAASSRGVIGGAVAGEGGGLPWEAAAGGRAPAFGRADGGPAGRRQARQVALQTLQRGRATGRHARAVRLIVAPARLPDSVACAWLGCCAPAVPVTATQIRPAISVRGTKGCSGRAVMMRFPSLSRPCAQCRRDGVIGKRLPSRRASGYDK